VARAIRGFDVVLFKSVIFKHITFGKCHLITGPHQSPAVMKAVKSEQKEISALCSVGAQLNDLADKDVFL